MIPDLLPNTLVLTEEESFRGFGIRLKQIGYGMCLHVFMYECVYICLYLHNYTCPPVGSSTLSPLSLLFNILLTRLDATALSAFVGVRSRGESRTDWRDTLDGVRGVCGEGPDCSGLGVDCVSDVWGERCDCSDLGVDWLLGPGVD